MIHKLKNRSVIRDHFRETSIVQSRLVAISFLVILLFFILAVRLIYLQIYQYDKFTVLANKNRVDIQPIAPIRGLIFDRNGEPLATNVRTYNLEILPNKVDDMPSLVSSISELIDISDTKLEHFKEQIKHRPSFERQVLRANLSEKEAARFSANQHRLKGAFLVAALQRYYPLGSLMGHALGYVGRINKKELQTLDKKTYGGTHYIGKLGIEANYEDLLLGEVGSKSIETNAHGRQVRALTKQRPASGKSLFLSLDSQLQAKAADLLKGVEGAIVALEPSTGEILSFVSMPSYDTNSFVNGIGRKDYASLRESDRRPLLNRALNGRYAPGSTIKGFMGLIAMKNGYSPKEKIYAPGWYSLPDTRHRYRCWKKTGHGLVDLHDAITQSCDVYFYRAAKRLGIDRLHEGMSAFGFGKVTKVDIPNEPSALMPSKAWKKRTKNQPWYPGETIITGIGQGFMLVTPIQLASAAALLANKGQGVVPHFLTAIQDPDNGDLTQIPYAMPGKVTNIQDSHYDVVIKAMRDVVHGSRGTARRQGQGLAYEIAGKTGTAQVKSIAQGAKYEEEKTAKIYRDHSLFIAFAPVEAPKIAVAIIVEHGGSGSKVAAPIARKLIDYYLVDRLGLYPPPPPDKKTNTLASNT